MNRLSRIDEKASKEKGTEKNFREEATTNIKKKVRIVGNHGVGKTSFLYKSYFKYTAKEPDTQFDVIPTSSHNVEVIPYKSYQFEIWDFAGKNSIL